MSSIVRALALRDGAQLPRRGSAAASGYDLHACLDGGSVTIGQTPVLIPTGLALEVPQGIDAQLRPRSGLARQGVIASFGTLDADYRGEVMIGLYTTSPEITHVVQHGDRIAQVVFARLEPVVIELVNELGDTERGAGGHGSTGR